MKRSLAALSLAVLMGVFSSSAHALFTRCEMTYSTNSLALGLEIGGGGGVVECWDAVGNYDAQAVSIGLIGAGIKIGACEAYGSISAVGAGFTLNQFLSALAQVEVGAIMTTGGTIGLGARINPFGVDMEVTASQIEYAGVCLGLGSVQGLIAAPAN